MRLKLVYIDFWSAVKLSFLVWLCLGIVLDRRHRAHLDRAQLDRRLRCSSNKLLKDILGGPSDFAMSDSFARSGDVLRVRRRAAQPVVGTALGAIIAVLYNLSVSFTGGLLVGFTEQLTARLLRFH